MRVSSDNRLRGESVDRRSRLVRAALALARARGRQADTVRPCRDHPVRDQRDEPREDQDT